MIQAGRVLARPVFIFIGWGGVTGLSVGIGVALAHGAHQSAAGILIAVLGTITATVFAVIVAVRWSLAVPVVMLERRGPIASLGRSWRLVRRIFSDAGRVTPGGWWTVVALAVLIVALIAIRLGPLARSARRTAAPVASSTPPSPAAPPPAARPVTLPPSANDEGFAPPI